MLVKLPITNPPTVKLALLIPRETKINQKNSESPLVKKKTERAHKKVHFIFEERLFEW